MNTTHLPQYPLNGTQLECDGSELRTDGTCAKCERINERIESHYAALPPSEATQPAETPRVRDFATASEFLDAYNAAAVAHEIMEQIKKGYGTGYQFTTKCEEDVAAIIAKYCAIPAPAEAGDVERLRDLDPLEFWQDLAEALGHARPEKADVPALVSEVGELRAELSAAQNEISTGFDVIFPYIVEANDTDGAPLSLADKIEILGSTNDVLNASLSTARANAIRECRDLIESKQVEWEKLGDYGVSRGYVYRIRGSNEILAALESLAKGEGDDGPTGNTTS